MKLRSIVILSVAATLSVIVLRMAAVEAYSTRNRKWAAAWPTHPTVVLGTGLAEIGLQARQGRPIDPQLVEELVSASLKAPLSPEPYLVRGTEALQNGKSDMAVRAFLAARDRDPRSIASRYFLAEHYLRAGQGGEGLAEIAALTRLVPKSLASVGPYLADYARRGGTGDELREMLRQYPELEPVLMNVLAEDARDAGLVMSLWSGRAAIGSEAWQSKLLWTLVGAGRYREARDAWFRFSGDDKSEELENLPFAVAGGGPFEWTLTSGPSGIAEAGPDGNLSVIAFGLDDVSLASRVMMLSPGTYRMSMRVDGNWRETGPVWILSCLPGRNEILRLELPSGAARRPAGGRFRIAPAGCEAQRIELAVAAPELPAQLDMTIMDFRIEREAGL